MSNDLCKELNHVMFDSSDPEKHDQLQHSFLTPREKKMFWSLRRGNRSPWQHQYLRNSQRQHTKGWRTPQQSKWL